MTVCVFAAQCAVASGSGITRPAGMITGGGIERGITRILCSQDEPSRWISSRGIILNVGQPELDHDVLLAPAHGLPADSKVVERDCIIAGSHGSTEHIAAVWLAENRNVPGSGDWAVLMTRRRIQGEISRLSARFLPPDTLERLVADETSITLMMQTSSADQDDCRMLFEGLQSELHLESGVFFHSCMTWPGVSGAPIVVAIDGAPVVIGFTIAARVRPLRYEGPLYIGIGRAIDEQIAAAVRRATERARIPGKKGRRRH